MPVMDRHSSLRDVRILDSFSLVLFLAISILFFYCEKCNALSYLQVQTDGAGDYVKVAFPQLMDRTSLRLPPKSLALEIAQFYTDLFMRRAFFASILPFKPDVILFLGDQFDGGPYLSDEEWQESLSRLQHIFGLKNQRRYKDMQVYYMPGNHDIGYSSLHSHRPEVVRRYEKELRMGNYRFTVGKVEFIAIDALTIDSKSGSS